MASYSSYTIGPLYCPKAFEVRDQSELLDAMREIGAATVVFVDPYTSALLTSFVPTEVVQGDDDTSRTKVRFHLAKANPQQEALRSALLGRENDRSRVGSPAQILLIYSGPQGYISPSYFPSKKTSGKVVPTWNYLLIHATGRVTDLYTSRDALIPHLRALTARFEEPRDQPWQVEDAPGEYIDALTKAIVGFEITLDGIIGKRKMSQNKSQDEQLGIVQSLRREGRADLASLASVSSGVGESSLKCPLEIRKDTLTCAQCKAEPLSWAIERYVMLLGVFAVFALMK